MFITLFFCIKSDLIVCFKTKLFKLYFNVENNVFLLAIFNMKRFLHTLFFLFL